MVYHGTEERDMNNTRYLGAGSGTSGTNALMIAGYNPPNNLANTEAWDGSTWTEVADLSTAVRANAASQAGSFQNLFLSVDLVQLTRCKQKNGQRLLYFQNKLKDNYFLIQQQTRLKKQ